MDALRRASLGCTARCRRWRTTGSPAPVCVLRPVTCLAQVDSDSVTWRHEPQERPHGSESELGGCERFASTSHRLLDTFRPFCCEDDGGARAAAFVAHASRARLSGSPVQLRVQPALSCELGRLPAPPASGQSARFTGVRQSRSDSTGCGSSQPRMPPSLRCLSQEFLRHASFNSWRLPCPLFGASLNAASSALTPPPTAARAGTVATSAGSTSRLVALHGSGEANPGGRDARRGGCTYPTASQSGVGRDGVLWHTRPTGRGSAGVAPATPPGPAAPAVWARAPLLMTRHPSRLSWVGPRRRLQRRVFVIGGGGEAPRGHEWIH